MRGVFVSFVDVIALSRPVDFVIVFDVQFLVSMLAKGDLNEGDPIHLSER